MIRSRWIFGATFLAVAGAALLAQTQSTPDAGLFLMKTAGDPERVHGTIADAHQKNVGANILKSTLTFGRGGAPTEEFSIKGEAATLRVDANASFLFRLTQKQPSASDPPPMPDLSQFKGDAHDMNSIMGSAADMPNYIMKKAEDFVLVHLTAENGSRHYDASQARNGGWKPDSTVALKVDKTATDTYTVQSKVPLAPGEYAFTYGGPGGGGQLWSFGVDGK